MNKIKYTPLTIHSENSEKHTKKSHFHHVIVFILCCFIIFLVWPHSSKIAAFTNKLIANSTRFETKWKQTDIINLSPNIKHQSINQQQQSYIPLTPPYKLPPEIRQTPDLEAMFCVNGTYDCIDFPEVSRIPSKLANIKYSVYSQNINDLSKHTNPHKSEYFFTENSTHIKMEIFPKDSNGDSKQYLGDYWNARVVPKSENKGYIPNQTSDANFGTFIPLKIQEIQDQNIYQINLSKSHPLFKKNSAPQTEYSLQIFFIRTSEMASLHRRLQSKIIVSNRIWWAQFENVDDLSECSPLAPFLLEDFYDETRICAISDKPGREFYCKVKDTKVCQNNKLDPWFQKEKVPKGKGFSLFLIWSFIIS